MIRGVAIAIALGTDVVYAQSNIDPANKFAWGENVGWTNWLDANVSNDGVIVGTDFLEGFVWGENVGWINVGDGTPTNGTDYANVNGTDFGVNVLGDNDLDGFAWGENIGWINFGWGAAADEADRARFDFGAGRFRGYAWGENVGWINLDDAVHFVAATCISCQLFGDIVDVSFAAIPDCLVDVSDLLCVLDDFADPGLCLGDGDLVAADFSCVQDSVIDVSDLLAELDAFSGIYGCPHPCPP